MKMRAMRSAKDALDLNMKLNININININS
jgi:hypothetical protein